MTVEKNSSIGLNDIVAIRFRCACGSYLSQNISAKTGSSVVYKCAGCGADWHEQDHQEYMLSIKNFLVALGRLKKKEPKDPSLEIALEFKD